MRKISGHEVHISNSIRGSGVTYSDQPTLDEHIEKNCCCCPTVYFEHFKLAIWQRYSNFFAYVRPLSEYYSPVWSPLMQGTVRQTESVQKSVYKGSGFTLQNTSSSGLVYSKFLTLKDWHYLVITKTNYLWSKLYCRIINDHLGIEKLNYSLFPQSADHQRAQC